AIAVCGAILLGATCAAPADQNESPKAAGPAESAAPKKSHAFKGTVQQVDVSAKTLLVHNENVDGWMAAMTMAYKADNEDILKTIKAGDTITATVYDGDYQTLHGVKVAPK